MCVARKQLSELNKRQQAHNFVMKALMGAKTETFSVLVSASEHGMRLDLALPKCTDLSRRRARKLILAGSVFIDGERVRVQSRGVKRGQKIRYSLLEQKRTTAALEILHNDDAIMVVNKRPYSPATPTRQGSANTALEWAREHHEGELFVVHRIDFETSGALLFAKNKDAARVWSERFANNSITREYLALSETLESAIDIDAPLLFESSQRRALIHDEGKASFTSAFPLLSHEGLTLSKVSIRTGRTHQIRAHLAHVGSALVGDVKYEGRAPKKDLFGLHASRLIDEELSVHASVAPAFWRFCAAHFGEDALRALEDIRAPWLNAGAA